jgi:hypothetical protein
MLIQQAAPLVPPLGVGIPDHRDRQRHAVGFHQVDRRVLADHRRRGPPRDLQHRGAIETGRGQLARKLGQLALHRRGTLGLSQKESSIERLSALSADGEDELLLVRGEGARLREGDGNGSEQPSGAVERQHRHPRPGRVGREMRVAGGEILSARDPDRRARADRLRHRQPTVQTKAVKIGEHPLTVAGRTDQFDRLPVVRQQAQGRGGSLGRRDRLRGDYLPHVLDGRRGGQSGGHRL